MTKTIEITLDTIERLGTSFYGNPYYAIHTIDGEVIRTQINGGLNYEVTNYRRGMVLELQLTRAGRAYSMRPIGRIK